MRLVGFAHLISSAKLKYTKFCNNTNAKHNNETAKQSC